MAGSGLGIFAGNFMQAFQGAQRQRQQQAIQQQELKLRTKLFETQLQKEQLGLTQEQGKQDALDKLTFQSQTRLQPSDPNAAVSEMRRPTLTELLADPQNAMLALKSGAVSGDEILKAQKVNPNQALIDNFLRGGGGGGAAGPGGTGAGGMELSGVKFDGSGNPMLDFSRQEVTKWMPSPDGRSMVGYDKMGRAVASQPAGPSERAPEDVPLPPSSLADMRDRNGNMLPPGTTLRQAQTMGATTAPKPAESDKKSLMLLSGMNDAEQTISGLRGADTSSLLNAAANSNPITRFFTSEGFRKYEAAGKRWAQNYLYLKSGAQASEKEVNTTFQTFFPQPGDPEDVKAQKEQARMQEAQNVSRIYYGKQGNSPAGGPGKVIHFNDLPQ